MWESILFYLCGGLMVLSGILMITSRNAVVAACWLIVAFLNAAGIFALLSAPFLAILQVLVYAGAIMVLFLFVIMMLQGPVLPTERRRRGLGGWVLVLAPVAAIVAGILRWWPAEPGQAARALPAGFGSVEQVAGVLLNQYLFAFELISIILLVAIIGALALGLVERRKPWR
jgi:NADH-quinone oxidoreductase subunit J